MVSLLRGLNHVLSHPLNRHRKTLTIIRIFFWKLYQRIIGTDCIYPLTNQCRMVIPANSSFGALIVYCKGYIDPIERLLVEKTVSDDDVFIDVGANIGYYSCLAANKGASVFAFEPNTQLHSVITNSFSLNNFKNEIVLSDAIISNEQGYEYFSIHPISELSHITHSAVGSLRKPSIALDHFVETNRINHIQFLKIDVEGAEDKVFQGMTNIFGKNKLSYMLFEHDPKNLNKTSYLEQIESFRGKYQLYKVSQYSLLPCEDVHLTSKCNLFVKFR